MEDFYGEVIDQLLRDEVMSPETELLVTCGGQRDRSVLRARHFTNVVISNVDPRTSKQEFAPFSWCYQNAERLTFDDGSFDFCMVHSGLHHCRSPHQALLEMYRVARKGLVLFEPYDNFMTRLGVRLNIGQEYEHASVFQNNYEYGGVGNTSIPNFVYRFTEREIIKTINCFDPQSRSDVRFIHKMRIPWTQLRNRRNRTLFTAVWLAQPALRLLELCCPQQSNNFATVVLKPELPDGLHPWLRQDGETVTVDEKWLADRYRNQPPAMAGH